MDHVVFEYGSNKRRVYYKKLLRRKQIKLFNPLITKLQKFNGVKALSAYRARKRYEKRLNKTVVKYHQHKYKVKKNSNETSSQENILIASTTYQKKI